MLKVDPILVQSRSAIIVGEMNSMMGHKKQDWNVFSVCDLEQGASFLMVVH